MQARGSNAPGWYGKLPCMGDFGSRRLDAAWIERWDDWLCRVVDRLRQNFGQAWRRAYLSSPVWRFAVGGGVVDERAWAGVIMPSVDRVGRLFPLTLAAPLGAMPQGQGAVDALREWLAVLGAAALATLDQQRPIEALERDLERIDVAPAAPAPEVALTGMSAQAATGLIASASDGGASALALYRLFAELPVSGAGAVGLGYGVWWPDEDAEIRLEPCAGIGLPEPVNVVRRLSALVEETGQ